VEKGKFVPSFGIPTNSFARWLYYCPRKRLGLPAGST